MLRKIKEIFFCAFSGILLSLPFFDGRLWIFAWFGFVPLFFSLENKSKGRAFFLGVLTGVAFWAATIFWLAHVTLAGTMLLILYLALYCGLFGLVVSSVVHRSSPVAFFVISSAWVLLEYLRSFLLTGFPWALLGYSQYLNLPAIQIADTTGVWGVSFVVMMGNAAVYSAVRKKRAKKRAKKRVYAIPFIVVIAALLYGYGALLRTTDGAGQRAVKISVIQGNIPQELKWESGQEDFILHKYLSLTAQAALASPDVIVWPEASFPEAMTGEGARFDQLRTGIREYGIPLLVGAVLFRDGLYYNSAVLFSGDGAVRTTYDKIHLVPFGEYIPLKKIFPFLQTIVPIGDITPGKQHTLFAIGNNSRCGVLICFEDVFPELARKFRRNGADFLVNITNDAWYKVTPAAWQHMQASVLRAVENRVPVVRAANTGVSGCILPTGKITTLVHDKSGRTIFVDGVASEDIFLPLSGQESFYTRHGDIFIFLLSIAFIYSIFRLR